MSALKQFIGQDVQIIFTGSDAVLKCRLIEVDENGLMVRTRYGAVVEISYYFNAQVGEVRVTKEESKVDFHGLVNQFRGGEVDSIWTR